MEGLQISLSELGNYQRILTEKQQNLIKTFKVHWQQTIGTYLKVKTSYRKNKYMKYLIEDLNLKMRECYLMKVKNVLKLKVYMNKENLFVKNAQIIEIQYLGTWKVNINKDLSEDVYKVIVLINIPACFWRD